MNRLLIAIILILSVISNANTTEPLWNTLTCLYTHSDNQWTNRLGYFGEPGFLLPEGTSRFIYAAWTRQENDKNYAVCARIIGTESNSEAEIELSSWSADRFSNFFDCEHVSGEGIALIKKVRNRSSRGSFVEIQNSPWVAPYDTFSMRIYIATEQEILTPRPALDIKCDEISP